MREHRGSRPETKTSRHPWVPRLVLCTYPARVRTEADEPKGSEPTETKRACATHTRHTTHILYAVECMYAAR